jgi:hypothetical protein
MAVITKRRIARLSLATLVTGVGAVAVSAAWVIKHALADADRDIA